MIALPLGLALILQAETARGRLSAIVFAAAVVAMFGASALYHSPNWREAPRRWLRRVDHAGVFGLIAGTYTAFGLLALSGYWRCVVLSIVWAGALAAIVFKFAWIDAPKWISAVIGVALGWIGVVVAPQLLGEIGVAASLLVLAGGLLYTLGGHRFLPTGSFALARLHAETIRNALSPTLSGCETSGLPRSQAEN